MDAHKSKNRWSMLVVLSAIWTGCRTTERRSEEAIRASPSTAALTENEPSLKRLGLSIPELHDLLVKGDLTVEELTKFYLDRIERLNHKGPALHAVISVNPRAISKARELDKLSQEDKLKSDLLWGIPILISDMIETEDTLPTTAGSTAMKRYFPRKDADVVANLRKKGAIILGKANVGQWGGMRGTPGWSALGGQTINPHQKETAIPGASAGAAAALAGGLAVAAIGTGTVGSLLYSAASTGVVAINPPRDLVSQIGLIPINQHLDTVGPLTHSLDDALIILERMINEQKNLPPYFTDEVAANPSELRIGYMTSGKKKISREQRKKWDQALQDLAATGAQLVPISDNRAVHIDCESELTVTAGLRLYLEPFLKNLPKDLPVHSLEELSEHNTVTAKEMLTSFGSDFLHEAEAIESSALVMEERLEKCRKVAADWYQIAALRQVQVIVDLIPSQSVVWSAFQGTTTLSLPIGLDENGSPVGLGIFAVPGHNQALMPMARALESKKEGWHIGFPQVVLPE